jgi:hypothetical protein
MSAKSETSEPVPNNITISVINESELETTQGKWFSLLADFKENANPLQKFINFRVMQNPEYIETPFKQYPLPFSPLKATNLDLSITPIQQKSPLVPFPSLKPVLGENDIFAISPGMFPRKTKPLDFLDILEDSERKDFMSPIKIASANMVKRSQAVTLETPMNQQESQNDDEEHVVKNIDIGFNINEEIMDGIDTLNFLDL